MLSKITVSVYRANDMTGEIRDCTNGGITAVKNRFNLYLSLEAYNDDYNRDLLPALLLIVKESGYRCCRPIVNGKVAGNDQKMTGYMMGGNFVYTSDSRFETFSPTGQPLPVHDRRETWEMYEHLSR